MWRRIPRWLRIGVGLVLAVLLVEYVVLPRASGTRRAVGELTHLQPAFLAAGLALEAGALIAYAVLTRVLLPAPVRPSLWTTVRVDVTGFGVSHTVPGGDATASALRFRLLVETGVPGRDAATSATVQGVGSAVVLNALLWLALVVSIPLRGGNALYTTAAAVGAVLLLLVAATVVALTRGRRTADRVVRAVARRVPRVDPDRAEEVLRTVTVRLYELGRDRRVLVAAIGWATANWLLDAAALWVFVAAYGHATVPDGLLVAFGLANVLAVLPVTPGGLGIVEGVLVPTLVGFGVPRDAALLGVLSYRAVQFWLPIPVAGLAYLSLRRTLDRGRQGSTERAAVSKRFRHNGPLRR